MIKTKRGMPTHLDRYLPPFPVDKVKMVMVHQGPRRLPLQMRDPVLAPLDFPYQRRSLGHQDQEKTRKARVVRKILLGQLMFFHPRFAMEERKVLLLRIGVHSATESPRHPLQMLLIQTLVRTRQLLPPETNSASLLTKGEIAVEHDPIHTVIKSFQKFLVVFSEIVFGNHRPSPPECFRPHYGGKGRDRQIGCQSETDHLKMEVIHSPGATSFNQQGRSGAVDNFSTAIRLCYHAAPQGPLFPRRVAEKAYTTNVQNLEILVRKNLCLP